MLPQLSAGHNWRESRTIRFKQRISGEPVSSVDFQRKGSQGRFSRGRVPKKDLQMESFQRQVKSESFQRQQPCFWTPSSESVCLSAASQSRALQEAVHIIRQCLGRVPRKSGHRKGFQGRVSRGSVPREGLQSENFQLGSNQKV